MTWNYRILAHEEPDGVILQAHRVHYDGFGNPSSYSETPAVINGSDRKEIYFILNDIIRAAGKPILYAGEKFPQIYKP